MQALTWSIAGGTFRCQTLRRAEALENVPDACHLDAGVPELRGRVETV